MQYFIVLSQLSLLVIFVFTFKCEMSKHCSDSFVFVSIRAFIMCVSAIAFFLLFEKVYHNITFLMVVFVPILSGSLYIVLELMSPSKRAYKREDYDDFTMEKCRQQESNIKL